MITRISLQSWPDSSADGLARWRTAPAQKLDAGAEQGEDRDHPAAGARAEQKFRNDGHVVAPTDKAGKLPEIITDPQRLPPAVARTRDRILAAARSGELTSSWR